VINDAAQAIYNEFIAETAPSEINISHSHKKVIRDKVRLLWSFVSRVSPLSAETLIIRVPAAAEAQRAGGRHIRRRLRPHTAAAKQWYVGPVPTGGARFKASCRLSLCHACALAPGAA
jgi:hypothetical protein